MTPKELYEWAVERGVEDYEIDISWFREYGFGSDFINETDLYVNESAKKVGIAL
jgi:hypothetical protein|nr:MAG TPA: hypothetical protein [Caudoviricetes sp.]